MTGPVTNNDGAPLVAVMTTTVPDAAATKVTRVASPEVVVVAGTVPLAARVCPPSTTTVGLPDVVVMAGMVPDAAGVSGTLVGLPLVAETAGMVPAAARVSGTLEAAADRGGDGRNGSAGG